VREGLGRGEWRWGWGEEYGCGDGVLSGCYWACDGIEGDLGAVLAAHYVVRD